jgi:hypothetical protein
LLFLAGMQAQQYNFYYSQSWHDSLVNLSFPHLWQWEAMTGVKGLKERKWFIPSSHFLDSYDTFLYLVSTVCSMNSLMHALQNVT